MAVHRSDVVAALAVHDPAALRAILEAAGAAVRGAETPDELAHRIADALWWNWCTPLGYVTDRATLDDMVDAAAKKLDVAMAVDGDAWARLRDLTVQLSRLPGVRIDAADAHRGVSLEDLAPMDARIRDSWFPAMASASGGAASLGVGAAGRAVVWLGTTPIGRVLPFIPKIGPIWRGIRVAGGAAAVVGTPLAVALSVVALHQSMSTTWRRLIPLLLGVGALGPTAVPEAEEVGS